MREKVSSSTWGHYVTFLTARRKADVATGFVVLALFPGEDCRAGDIVVAFRGERLRKTGAKARLKNYRRLQYPREYQITMQGTSYAIDATVAGNRGKYCNHSSNPNAAYFQ